MKTSGKKVNKNNHVIPTLVGLGRVPPRPRKSPIVHTLE